MTARSVEEIRADLATEEGRGGLRRLSPIGRLVADVPELIDSRERAIRWAGTLESQNAEAVALAEEMHRSGVSMLMHWSDILRAALTGSTE